MVTAFSCDLLAPASGMPHFWEHTVGSGHATLGLRSDWQAQMRRAHRELGFGHVRLHGLLGDDMGTLVGEGDTLFYSFFNADQLFDFLLSIGMRPFVELSFMPSILASGRKTAFHYRANVTPPRDYAQWASLIRRLVVHWIERYGAAEDAHGSSRYGTSQIWMPSAVAARTSTSCSIATPWRQSNSLTRR